MVRVAEKDWPGSAAPPLTSRSCQAASGRSAWLGGLASVTRRTASSRLAQPETTSGEEETCTPRVMQQDPGG
eukprot:365747-Chlamydomonas_euryale.AAC.68